MLPEEAAAQPVTGVVDVRGGSGAGSHCDADQGEVGPGEVGVGDQAGDDSGGRDDGDGRRSLGEELMALAFVRDPGLRVIDFADAARALDGIPAGAFAPYGLDQTAVSKLLAQFADWPREAHADEAGLWAHRETHAGTHPPSPGS